MFSCMHFLRNPKPWLAAALLPFLACASLSGYGWWWFLSILLLTPLVLILSAIPFIFSEQKPVLLERLEQEEVNDISESEGVKPKCDAITENQEEKFQENGMSHHQPIQEADLYSETESIDDHQSSTSEDSDVDWLFFCGKLGQSPDCSDDSISDEESLIEIAIPSGHYVCPKEAEEEQEEKEEDPKYNLQQKFPVFGQNNLMELLAELNEINEEDNLIEIDISMGSIKCSRFEIEA